VIWYVMWQDGENFFPPNRGFDFYFEFLPAKSKSHYFNSIQINNNSIMKGGCIVKPLVAAVFLVPSEAFPSPTSTSKLFRAPSSPRSSFGGFSPGSRGSRWGSTSTSTSQWTSSFPSLAFPSHRRYSTNNPSFCLSRQNFRRKRIPCTKLLVSSSSSSNDDSSTYLVNGDADTELTRLRNENKLLQERLKLLQTQNDQLVKQQQESTTTISSTSSSTHTAISKKQIPYEQRLILEDFEGEGIPTFDARGGMIDGWDKSKRRYSEPWDDEEDIGEYMEFEVEGARGSTKTKALARIGRLSIESEENDDELGLSAPLEDDVCEYDDQTNKWMSSVGECPVEPNITFVDALKSRAKWLVGLLFFQSCSGFILSRNEILLQDHPVIIYFLTMLVGAGGNAGNQASVRVIRGLALGTLNPETQSQFLSRELRMAFALSLILSLAGFLRATLFHTPLPETMAITLALSMIVFSSICLGAVLPLLLQKVGIDPAHSSTSIQVMMDILGGECSI
jgi:cation transporter-like permease